MPGIIDDTLHELAPVLAAGVFALMAGLITYMIVPSGTRAQERIPYLVLREYRVSHTDQLGSFVLIAGRPEGVWSWLLSIVGLGTDIRFEVGKAAVQREMIQAHWHTIDSVPLQNVASTNFGYTKTTFYLVVAAFLMFLGPAGFVVASLSETPPSISMPVTVGSVSSIVAGVIFLLSYFLSKRLIIQVETAGGRFIGVCFKPSAIGQLTVDLNAASEAVRIINSLIASGPIPGSY